jgi:pimeloyl-ACP methyl ester carboxylesterase
MEPTIRFCTGIAGRHLAYATVGRGPVVVCPAWWMSHVERDWADPAFRGFFTSLARRNTIVRYDRPGTGLSDRHSRDYSLEHEVADLAAVVDHVGAPRVGLLALSCGGPPAVAYAARHPHRVSRLVLYGSYLRGDSLGTPEAQRTITDLVRAEWGSGAKALAELFIPGASSEAFEAFAAAQQHSSTPEVAALILELIFSMDASREAPEVRAPTLVLHRRDDRAVPFDAGRELAVRIPKASLRPLEGDIHVPWLGDANAVLQPTRAFLAKAQNGGPAPTAESLIRGAFIRRGDVWTVSFLGRTAHLKHGKGLADLAVLLQRPGELVPAIELLYGSDIPPMPASEPILDYKARAAYRQRLRDLDIEVEDAERRLDVPRADRLQRERDELIAGLRQAAGLGGRARRLGDASERARKAVTARIRQSIKLIAAAHPELGEHLERSVSTGAVCAYRPPEHTIWRT